MGGVFQSYMKKGQLSLFIILGTIIILAAIFFIVIRNTDLGLLEDESKVSHKDSLEGFVKSCLETTVRKAQEKIGQNGGHLYRNSSDLANYDSPQEVVKKSPGFKDLGGVGHRYWYYYDDLDESFKLDIPHYYTDDVNSSLKSQIKRYLNEHLEVDCIKGFSDKKEEFVVDYDPKDFNFDIEFRDENISVELATDFKIESLGAEGNIEVVPFVSGENYNFLRVPYFLALDIVSSQSQTSFLEIRQLQTIAPHQTSKNRELLPSFYEFEYGYSPSPWDVRKSKLLLSQLMNTYLREIKFTKTHIPTPTTTPTDFERQVSEIYDFDHSFYTLTDEEGVKEHIDFKEFKTYSVKPSFELFYPSYFTINSNSHIYLPDAQQFITIPFLGNIAWTIYTTHWDITMPILFELSLEDDPNNDFSFQFAIETNIESNEPLAFRSGSSSQTPSLRQPSLICDPNSLVSGEYILMINDEVSSDPVTDVLVEFNCKGIETCSIEAEEEVDNDVTELKFKLPVNCNPGTLKVSKAGHSPIIITNLDPKENEDYDIAIESGSGKIFPLNSAKEMKLDLKFCPVSRVGACIGNRLDRQEALVIFTHKQNEQFVSVVEVTEENQDEVSVELTTGTYDISIFALDKDVSPIPEDEECYDNTWNPFDDEKCEVLPEIELDSWVIGQYEFSDFKVGEDDITSYDTIKIRMDTTDPPESYDDLKNMGVEEEEDKDVRKPKFGNS